MGMRAEYNRVTPGELARMRADEEVAAAFFGHDIDWEADDEDEGYDEFFERQEAREAEGRYLNIEKAWHGLHYVLTGDPDSDFGYSPTPLYNVVRGGSITPWESEFGIRVLEPNEVAETDRALQNVTEAELRSRLVAAEFNKHRIYPNEDEWRQEWMDEFLETFTIVSKFFHDAALSGDAILLELS